VGIKYYISKYMLNLQFCVIFAPNMLELLLRDFAFLHYYFMVE